MYSRKEGSISYRADDCRDVVEKKVLYDTERRIVKSCSRKEGSTSYRAEDCRDVVEKDGSLSYRAEDCHDVVEKKVLYYTERRIVVML